MSFTIIDTFLLNFIRLKKSVQCIFILHLIKVQFHCFFGMFNPKLKFIFFLFFYQFLNFSTLARMYKITSHIYKYSCISSQVSMPSLCLDSCVLSDQCYGFSTVRYIYYVLWEVVSLSRYHRAFVSYLLLNVSIKTHRVAGFGYITYFI